MVGPDSFRLVQDWFDPQHGHMDIDRETGFSFNQDITIYHYLCADPWQRCRPFSIRLGVFDSVALRRSAPDIEQYQHVIRQAHLRGKVLQVLSTGGDV